MPIGKIVYRPPINESKGTIGRSNFSEVVQVKIGARVMLVYNSNIPDLLVNGALGTVIGIEFGKKGEIECIVVEFDSASCGQQHRARYPGLSKKYMSKNGTPIFQQEVEIQLLSKNGKNLGAGSTAKVRQFPIMIYYASTAHKIQVLT